VPERCGSALLGWVAEPDVRPVFYGSSVTSPSTVDDFVAAWKIGQDSKPVNSAAVPDGPQFSELPAVLADNAAALAATDQFRTQYQPFGATFVTVKLSELITPQWWADTAYADELAASLPAEDDLEGLFRFSFTEGHLAPPMLMGTNGAAFASPRRELGALSPLRIARHTAARVTFEFDVTPRPNWVWLAAVQGLSRPLILNGVHHLLALLKAGRKEAFGLLRPAQSLQELQVIGMNLQQDPGLFKPDQVTGSCPPLLRYYLDEAITQPVNVRTADQYMRTVIQTEIGCIPRGA
jgi:hypothetical protein